MPHSLTHYYDYTAFPEWGNLSLRSDTALPEMLFRAKSSPLYTIHTIWSDSAYVA